MNKQLCDNPVDKINAHDLYKLSEFLDFLSRYLGGKELTESILQYNYYGLLTFINNELFLSEMNRSYDGYKKNVACACSKNIAQMLAKKKGTHGYKEREQIEKIILDVFEPLPEDPSKMLDAIEENERNLYETVKTILAENGFKNYNEWVDKVREKTKDLYESFLDEISEKLYMSKLYKDFSKGKLEKPQNIKNEKIHIGSEEALFLSYLEENLIQKMYANAVNGLLTGRKELEPNLKDFEIRYLKEFENEIENPYCLIKNHIYFDLGIGDIANELNDLKDAYKFIYPYTEKIRNNSEKTIEESIIMFYTVALEEVMDEIDRIFILTSELRGLIDILSQKEHSTMEDYLKIKSEMEEIKDLSVSDFKNRIMPNIWIKEKMYTTPLYFGSYISYIVNAHIYLELSQEFEKRFRRYIEDEEEFTDKIDIIKARAVESLNESIVSYFDIQMAEEFIRWKCCH